jgi:hypothetical protein
MDPVWTAELLQHLGKRYRLGSEGEVGAEVLFRHGKAEFRPTRAVVVPGEPSPSLRFTQDLRIPKDAPDSEAETIQNALIERSMQPRGFALESQEVYPMTSDRGERRGSVRTLVFSSGALESSVAARHLRALVESLENPLIVGMHDCADVEAKDPMPEPPKPRTQADEKLEVWKYRLEEGLLSSLMIHVDPNDRTLRVVERKLVSSKQLGGELKLAHVARLVLRKTDSGMDLIAQRRDAGEIRLASGSGSEDFVATVARLAEKILIPLERA